MDPTKLHPLTINIQDAGYMVISQLEGEARYIYGDPLGIPTLGTGIALVVGGGAVWSPMSHAQLESLFLAMGKQIPAGLEADLPHQWGQVLNIS